MREVKVEWCENWIRALFDRIRPYGRAVETNLFWRMAQEACLYEPNTYGSPMTQAIEKLCNVRFAIDENGNHKYSVFEMKEDK